MKFKKGVLLTCDPALKVYLTERKKEFPSMYGESAHDKSLDDENIFVFDQTEAIVPNLQQIVDSWIKEHTYQDESVEDEEFDD